MTCQFLNPWFFFFHSDLFSEPESLEDEKDENHRMRQMQGNTVVMHICAHEKSLG